MAGVFTIVGLLPHPARAQKRIMEMSTRNFSLFVDILNMPFSDGCCTIYPFTVTPSIAGPQADGVKLIKLRRVRAVVA